MNFELLQKSFREHADTEKAVKMSAYMRDQFPHLGIPTPLRKELSRDFYRNTDQKSVDWDLVFACWELPEREFQYFAVGYLATLKAALTPTDIPNLRKIVISKSWWDTIDGLDVIIGDIALRYPKVNKTLLVWSKDKNFWLRRIAIDHQLQRKDRTDTSLMEQILVNNFGQKEFFINKAIGWSLREYSKTDPEWVRGFLERHRDEMAPLSIREASKYV